MNEKRQTGGGFDLGISPSLEVSGAEGKLVIGRRKPVTLIMFSGGVDSTYQLVKFLKETDDEILAHHVHFLNVEGRHQAEARRCREIVRFCRKEYRDFRYSETAIDHRGMPFYGYDIIAAGFEAGIVSHGYFMEHKRMVTRWLAGHCLEEKSSPERLPHVLACVAANCFPLSPPEFLRVKAVSKLEELNYLDPQLHRMMWTCRTPIRADNGFEECGVCQTCKVMVDVRRQYVSK